MVRPLQYSTGSTPASGILFRPSFGPSSSACEPRSASFRLIEKRCRAVIQKPSARSFSGVAAEMIQAGNAQKFRANEGPAQSMSDQFSVNQAPVEACVSLKDFRESMRDPINSWKSPVNSTCPSARRRRSTAGPAALIGVVMGLAACGATPYQPSLGPGAPVPGTHGSAPVVANLNCAKAGESFFQRPWQTTAFGGSRQRPDGNYEVILNNSDGRRAFCFVNALGAVLEITPFR